MPELFIDPSRVVAERMSPTMRTGLFLPRMDHAPVGLFYIAEGFNGGRTAIVLNAEDTNLRFVAWSVTDGMGSWEGLSLGDVEPLADAYAGTFYAASRPPRGELWIGRGRLNIGAKPENGIGTIAVPIGTSATTGPAEGMAFSRWRLVQRDHAGEPIVLFEA